VQERYIGGGAINSALVEGVDINVNHIGAVYYTDASVAYDFESGAEVFLNVTNLFNRSPPPALPPPSTFQNQPSNPDLYDTMGRYFTAGVRFKF
jgi:outer membrane receptor protein involved in Fe transport